MRELYVALLAAGALGLALLTSPAAADQPSPPSCEGQFISSRAQDETGRRNAAELFLGEYPQAVRDIEFLLQAACAP
jgi:hypothetical protein